jgi:hypothetical protein
MVIIIMGRIVMGRIIMGRMQYAPTIAIVGNQIRRLPASCNAQIYILRNISYTLHKTARSIERRHKPYFNLIFSNKTTSVAMNYITIKTNLITSLS